MKHHDISAIRRQRLQDAVDQHRLFMEVVETIETRDEPFEHADGGWGSKITRPAGKGWRVADSGRERHTKWARRTPVIWPGGWRRR